MSNKNQIIPSDYHDYIYRFTYFLLSFVAPYIPKSVTPNQITLLAFFFAMVGNACLFFIHTPIAYLYWVLFNLVSFLLDALDGMHARISGQSSEYGAFLDHAMDNIYFLFMLTVFAAKFDLTQILYIYIIILRVTAALMVFTVQCHTGRLYLSKFSGGLKFLLFSGAMVLSYAFPHANPLMWTQNAMFQNAVSFLNLQNGIFMKMALLCYFIGVPIAITQQFLFVNTVLKQERSACAD